MQINRNKPEAIQTENCSYWKKQL